MARIVDLPWTWLDEYRGSFFPGEWPTLPELFSLTAKRFPDGACFTVYNPDRKSLNYTEAGEKIAETARLMRTLGIGHEDRVAVTGKNSPEWAVAYLSVLFAGAVVVPIDYQLGTSEIANLVRAGEVSLVWCDEEKFDELARLVAPVPMRPLFPGRPGYIMDPALSAGYGAAGNAPMAGPAARELVPAVETDTAAILFTSGTTGQPKGVMLSHRNLVSDCFLAQANLSIHHTDVFYALLPIHHSYTMLAVFLESIAVGAEIVFGSKLVTKQILKDLKEAKITMFLGVPLLFNKVLAGIMKGIRAKGPVVYGLIRLLMAVSGLVKKFTGINPGKKMFHSVLEKASLATNRICISGGGPLAPSIFKQYNELGIDFVQGYGLTETSPILTLNPIDHYKETSVGRIIPRAQMQILDPDENGVGEIVVKGPMVMQGYYKMPEETAAVFTPDGWFRTGDLGYLDGEDYLYLTGRVKNLIVTEGGKNVYPEEIENRFQLFSEVEQVLVCGYQADRAMKSEGIEAKLHPDMEWFREQFPGLSGEDLWKEAESRMAGVVEEVNKKLLPYQRIGKITVLREALEMTTTKKIKRF